VVLLDILADGIRAAISTETAAFALAAIGLSMHYGYTGLLNFGQAGYLLVGGYGLAITVATFDGSFWLGLAAAGIASILLSCLLGLPTLRLRADYFAIASLAVTETVRLCVRSSWLEPITGGVYGLSRFTDDFFALNPLPFGRYGVGPWQFTADQFFVLVLGWGLVAIGCLIVWLLIGSPWGRTIRAIRGNEEAPQSLGKPVFLFKMQSLIIGGLFGTLAGILLAVHQRTVDPEGYLPTVTFFVYTALILGGAARIAGPVVGAVVFWLVLAITDSTIGRLSGGVLTGVLSPQELGTVRFILVGIVLMWLVVYHPRGLFGGRAEP